MNTDTLEQVLKHVTSVSDLARLCTADKGISRICRRMPLNVFLEMNRHYLEDYYSKVQDCLDFPKYGHMKKLLRLYPIGNVTGNKYIKRLQRLYIPNYDENLIFHKKHAFRLLFLPLNIGTYIPHTLALAKDEFLDIFTYRFKKEYVLKMYYDIVTFHVKSLYNSNFRAYQYLIKDLLSQQIYLDIPLLKSFQQFDKSLRIKVFVFFLDSISKKYGRENALEDLTPNSLHFFQTFSADIEYFRKLYYAFNVSELRQSLLNNG